MGPPPLYWLGTGWWCFDPCVLVPLSSIFVFFRSLAVSAVANQFVLLYCVYLSYFFMHFLLCACSTIFYFCLLSFPHRFRCSKLALFCFATCLCLISSCVSCCVCHFLQFDFSFLHAIPTIDTSCYSLFLFIMLLYISFHTYLLLAYSQVQEIVVI